MSEPERRFLEPLAAPAPAPDTTQPEGPDAAATVGAIPDLPPRRLHPAWIVISGVRQLRAFIVPLIIAVFVQSGNGQIFFLAGGSVVAVIGLIGQTVAWSYFRYEVAGGELRVRSGLLSRRERSVPLERIQALDTSENLLQRLFRVQQLKVETAAGGGAGSDVTLEALSRADAAALLDRLNAARPRRDVSPAPEVVPGAGAPQEPAVAAPIAMAGGEVLRRITTRDLVIAGATSGRIGPALAILAAAWQFADDILGDDIWERLALQAAHSTVQGVVVIVGAIALFSWLLAFASTVLTFGGFELRRQDDRLVVRHGLLDRRQATVPIARIQAITVSETLLRQPLRMASLRFESAGYGKDTPESGVLFPIIPLAEVSDLIARCNPAFAVETGVLAGRGLRGLPERSRGRYVVTEVRGVVVLTLIALAAARAIPDVPWWWGLWALTLAPLAALYGWLQYRDSGWTIDPGDRFVVRGRNVARHLTITPRRRLQRRAVTQNLFQRRVDLANFSAAVASGGSGGTVGIRHMDAGEAEELAARLGPGRRDGVEHAGSGAPWSRQTA